MWTSMVVALGVVLGAAPQAGARPERPRLLVLELGTGGGAEREAAVAFSEAVTQAAGAQGVFDVVSTREVQTLVGVERQRQLLGCTEESSSCLQELAGALGARFVLSGTLARLGAAWQLSLQGLDTSRAQPLGRSVRIATSLEALRGQLRVAVAEATATPLPPPPSRVLPLGLLAGGTALALGGGVVGLNALTRESTLNEELRRGEDDPSLLGRREEYRDRADALRRQKTVGAAGMVVGAGLAVAGAFLLRSTETRAVAAVQLAPGRAGLALAGVW